MKIKCGELDEVETTQNASNTDAINNVKPENKQQQQEQATAPSETSETRPESADVPGVLEETSEPVAAGGS